MNIFKCLMICLLFTSSYSYSQCYDLLKFMVAENTNTKHSKLTGFNTEERYQRYNKELLKSLEEYEDFIDINERAINPDLKKIEALIKEKLIEEKFLTILKLMNISIHNKGNITNWIENLHRDLVVETFLIGYENEINDFITYKIISQRILVKVLLDRSTAGGFSGNPDSIEHIKSNLTSIEFIEILKSGKLIIDHAFEKGDHGKYIHFLQVDFLIYILKSLKKNHHDVHDFYVWMGSTKNIPIHSMNSYFNIHNGAWAVLFDSFSMDYTSPEVLNPLINKYLKIK